MPATEGSADGKPLKPGHLQPPFLCPICLCEGRGQFSDSGRKRVARVLSQQPFTHGRLRGSVHTGPLPRVAPAPSHPSLTYLLESSLYLSLFFTCHVSSITGSCRFSRGLPEAALASLPHRCCHLVPLGWASRRAFPAPSRAPPLPSDRHTRCHTRHGRVSQPAALCPLTAGITVCRALLTSCLLPPQDPPFKRAVASLCCLW